MIICSCNVISDKDVAKATDHLIEENLGRKPTLSHIFAQLEAKPQCGSCVRTVKHCLDRAADSHCKRLCQQAETAVQRIATGR